MGGLDLARQLNTISERTAIVFTSGYSDTSLLKSAREKWNAGFLQKLLTIEELVLEIRQGVGWKIGVSSPAQWIPDRCGMVEFR
ncbi:MAG TPA: hypothetical protein PL033_08300 [Candidatus Brocadiia bacterium]|nr:hypothetical protein [Candidatus Brocadiia bacterium]